MVRHLYVHVPFCHRICPYCSFYKHTPGNTNQAEFVSALLSELADASHRYPVDLETIYLGGGTPSLLSKSHLATLLAGIGEHVRGNVGEWVLEANPSTFDISKAELMREHGVTRVSLGVQSWDNAVLETLGRDHSPEAATASFETLRASGIGSVNIDLMFAVPGQSLQSWLDTIDYTVTLEPDHISAYNLTYEEDTKFFERFTRGDYSRDEETDAAFYSEAIARLSRSGFCHYETSNYAIPGHESQHNWAYWRGKDYLGIGPGAVSTVAGVRWTTLPDTASYIRAVKAGTPTETSREDLQRADFLLERLGLMIRTRRGLPLKFLTESQQQCIPDLVAERLALLESGRLVLSDKGKLVADSVASHLASR